MRDIFPVSPISPISSWDKTYSREAACRSTGQVALRQLPLHRRAQSDFPPFSFFVDFVYGQAKARNDPSFILSNSSQSYNKSEKILFRHSENKTVSVYKTEFSAATDTSPKDADLDRYCPVHNITHPLAKCRAFRIKTLLERRNILKDHKRCLKCCSPNHLARDCQATLKCSECKSERHCSAMHIDTSQPRPSPMPDSDTEAQDGNPVEVTSRNTEVCGEASNIPRSCSKVCLVWVFPHGQPECSVQMYIILNDQSNRSLARSEFFHLFGIKGSLSPYLMRTCAGATEMTGRRATGFQIEAVNGGVCLDLPRLIECSCTCSLKTPCPIHSQAGPQCSDDDPTRK